ncbi:SPOR domain-containing protein [Rickettsiales bacterium]|nr:SPOR domain-containing protein [Rickettsiales bacterium]
MKNEDFGYMIETKGFKVPILSKKPIKIAIVLASILLFAIITVSAYYFSRGGDGKNIKLVKAPSHEIKVRNTTSNLKIRNIDKTIYDNVSGSNTSNKNTNIKIIKSPESIKPSKKEKQNSLSILNLKDQNDINDKVKIIISDQNSKIQKPYVRVQLAAFKSKESAYKYWKNLKEDYPKLFASYKYFIHEVKLGKRGIFYRLQMGYFSNQLKAEDFCIKFIAKAKKSKSDCIMVE